MYLLSEWPAFNLGDEVTAVHRFPLARLLSGEGRGSFVYHWDGHDMDLPTLTLDDAFIWGLTLRMIDDLLELLNPAATASPKV